MGASAELEQVLRQASDAVYIPNIGNAGDAFIAHATYQFFAKIGLAYRIGDLKHIYPGSTVIYGGGGALVEPYDFVAKFLERNFGLWRTLIVLPHTVRGYEELLNRLDSNVHLFCRERPSFDFTVKSAPKAHVHLADDMALGSNLSAMRSQLALIRRPGSENVPHALRLSLRLLKRLRKDKVRALAVSRPGVLNAFRTDLEKTSIGLPDDNIDISEEFADSSMMPLVALHTTYRMMKFLSNFSRIRTNRLHVAIMAALLELKVDFYDNNYHKNRDVYEYSMRDKFANVRWCSN